MITENPFSSIQELTRDRDSQDGSEHVHLDMSQTTGPKGKRLLHFSDGVMEEDESDSEDQPDANTQLVDPKTLSWLPWFGHYASLTGSIALYYADYVGEMMANFFGITTPKYQLEINEYERQQAAQKKREEEAAGWIPSDSNAAPTVSQPASARSINEKPVAL